ncbi:MAG: alanyl-tRNA editing protein [Caldilineaceae bacterium]
MNELLYYEDANLREFDATVTAVESTDGGVRVALDRTAFYPGGGGQPNDTGVPVVDGAQVPVTKVKKEGDTVWHWLGTDGGEPSITPGAAVHGAVNWDRRYALMRTHTAMHILCGVVWRDYGAQVTGGNMDPGKGRMDFEFESLTRDLIPADRGGVQCRGGGGSPGADPDSAPGRSVPDSGSDPHRSTCCRRASPRYFTVGNREAGLAGGRRHPHVDNTADVGAIRVTDYKSKGKINKRIYIELG